MAHIPRWGESNVSAGGVPSCTAVMTNKPRSRPAVPRASDRDRLSVRPGKTGEQFITLPARINGGEGPILCSTTSLPIPGSCRDLNITLILKPITSCLYLSEHMASSIASPGRAVFRSRARATGRPMPSPSGPGPLGLGFVPTATLCGFGFDRWTKSTPPCQPRSPRFDELSL